MKSPQECALMQAQDPLEPEGRGIPFDLVNELLMFCTYASTLSIGIQLLLYTGCRIIELDNMFSTKRAGNYLYWECGKNQDGWRKEFLPDRFWKEHEVYLSSNRVPKGKMLSVCSETFTRYFRKFCRPFLSAAWREKRTVIKDGQLGEEYILMLKGFRKNWATLLFHYFWKKYDDAGVAVERVAKRMKHSSKEITAEHYIETCEQIEAHRFAGLLMFQVVANITQRRIQDYYEIDLPDEIEEPFRDLDCAGELDPGQESTLDDKRKNSVPGKHTSKRNKGLTRRRIIAPSCSGAGFGIPALPTTSSP